LQKVVHRQYFKMTGFVQESRFFPVSPIFSIASNEGSQTEDL